MAKSRFFGQKQNANMHIEHILFDKWTWANGWTSNRKRWEWKRQTREEKKNTVNIKTNKNRQRGCYSHFVALCNSGDDTKYTLCTTYIKFSPPIIHVLCNKFVRFFYSTDAILVLLVIVFVLLCEQNGSRDAFQQRRLILTHTQKCFEWLHWINAYFQAFFKLLSNDTFFCLSTHSNCFHRSSCQSVLGWRLSKHRFCVTKLNRKKNRNAHNFKKKIPGKMCCLNYFDKYYTFPREKYFSIIFGVCTLQVMKDLERALLSYFSKNNWFF